MPIVVVEPLVEAARELRLGRLALVTALDSIDEQAGSQLQVTGAQVTPGDPAGRDVSLTLPLYGDPADSDMFAAGLRARRQARSLTANRAVMRLPLWLQWDVDPEQNSWVMLGQATIKPNQGGITFADFNVEVSGYRVANRRTHRPARYLQITDRRLASTPRDFYGRVFSTDFATNTGATPRVVLPASVSDVTSTAGAVVTTSALQAIDGTLAVATGRHDGEVLSFEQPEAAERIADVLILDRQDIPAPAFTLAGDTDMQASYGWEEVYGTDHPLTAGDVPSLANGLCRTRWDAATATLRLDAYIAGTGYVEQASVGLDITAPSSVRVVAWTPEEAIIALTGMSGSQRVEALIALRRGWTAPRVQAYKTAGSGSATVTVTPATAGTTTVRKPDASTTTAAFGVQSWPGTNPEPVIWLQAPDPNLGVGAAVSSAETVVSSTIASSLTTVTLKAGEFFGDGSSWVDAHLWVGPRATIDTDTVAHGRNSLYDTVAVPDLVAR